MPYRTSHPDQPQCTPPPFSFGATVGDRMIIEVSKWSVFVCPSLSLSLSPSFDIAPPHRIASSSCCLSSLRSNALVPGSCTSSAVSRCLGFRDPVDIGTTITVYILSIMVTAFMVAAMRQSTLLVLAAQLFVGASASAHYRYGAMEVPEGFSPRYYLGASPDQALARRATGDCGINEHSCMFCSATPHSLYFHSRVFMKKLTNPPTRPRCRRFSLLYQLPVLYCRL
jgi:hypothetical protein